MEKILPALFVILKAFFLPLTFTVALTSCSSKNKPRNPKLISIALGSAPSSLNPVTATDASGMRISSLLYQGLVRIGTDLRPSADLADTWEVQGSKYKFNINNNKKFSDGSPILCKDLISSIENFQDSKSPFSSVFKVIKNPSCMNDGSNLVLKFELEKPSVKFLTADLPVLKIMKDGLGSGPFIMKENDPTHSLLEPNTHYTKPQEYSLEFKYLKDDFSRFLKVYKGEIDIAPNSIPFEKVGSFDNSDFQVIEKPSLSTSYLLVNHRNKILSDLNFRKYILEKINIDDLVKNRFDNHVTRAFTLLSPEHPYFPGEAATLNLKPENDKFKKALLTLKSSNSRQARETGKIISQKLRSSGVPMRLHSYEWGTFYKDIKSGNFDLALMKWVGVVDPDLYNLAFHSNEFPPGRNRGFYKNTQLDQKLDKASSIETLKERIASYADIQLSILKDLAIIPLWHENQIHIIHPRIKNYQVNPMGDFHSFLDLKVIQ